MKKKLLWGLSLVLAVTGLAACGGRQEEANTGKSGISGEIRYAFWDSAQEAYFEKCVEEFNKIYPDLVSPCFCP